jgi:hypothetical protein
MQLRLEGPLTAEDQLRTDLGEADIGRTWWIDYVWYIWTGSEGGWQKMLAVKGRRPWRRRT